MNRRTFDRIQRITRLTAVPVALLVSGLLVSVSSYAAFSATTSNPGNSWTTGTLDLVDDDSGSAMFAVTGLQPGDTGSRCIRVTASGTTPADVRLYAEDLVDSATSDKLSDAITLQIVEGTGGSSGSCSGFAPAGPAIFNGTLGSLATSATDYATGLGSWQTTGSAPRTVTYMFSYTLSSNAMISTQNTSVQLTFTWESQPLP